jgi:hypothetical protein
MAAMHVVTAAICAAVLVRAFRARDPDPAPATP